MGTGATEIVSILNITDDGSDSAEPKDFFQLFAEDDGNLQKKFKPWYKENEAPFPGFPDWLTFTIFSDKVEDIKEKYNDKQVFRRLIMNQSNKQLVSIKVGTVEVRPRDNEFFGTIGCGETVTIHVVVVSSKVNMGPLAALHEYSVLVQEIVAALSCLENLPLVESSILPAFLGQAKVAS